MSIPFIGPIPTPCKNKRIYSAIAGALVAYDPTLPIIGKPASLVPGLPPWAHYAAAGVALDVTCRGPDILNVAQEFGISAAAGIAGAGAIMLLTGRPWQGAVPLM